jgi:hypothetical protein
VKATAARINSDGFAVYLRMIPGGLTLSLVGVTGPLDSEISDKMHIVYEVGRSLRDGGPPV